jgi:hypothetical protein
MRDTTQAISTIALTLTLSACGDNSSGSNVSGSSEETDAETSADSSMDSTSESESETETGDTSDDGTTGPDECGSRSPALLCDTMLPFYEHARALHESTETGCQLYTIFGRSIGPEGILVADVFASEPGWFITYVCPGRRIEYAYTASAAEYPLVTEFVEDIDPSSFKQIESALSDSPAMMELYTGTNCPDILSLENSRFFFQPSGIAMSTALFTIGGVIGATANITVDEQGQVVEIFPCL